MVRERRPSELTVYRLPRRNCTARAGAEEAYRFTSFVKIGSGMSYTDYEWIM